MFNSYFGRVFIFVVFVVIDFLLGFDDQWFIIYFDCHGWFDSSFFYIDLMYLQFDLDYIVDHLGISCSLFCLDDILIVLGE